MKTIIACAMITLGTHPAFAGSANVGVTCQSANGKVKIVAGVPGDEADASLILSLGAATKATYVNQSLIDDMKLNNMDPNATYPGYEVKVFSVIEKLNLGVYSIAVLDADNSGMDRLQLVAIPATLKIKIGRGSRKGTFKAILTAVNPDPKGDDIVNVPMNCSYDYSI